MKLDVHTELLHAYKVPEGSPVFYMFAARILILKLISSDPDTSRRRRLIG